MPQVRAVDGRERSCGHGRVLRGRQGPGRAVLSAEKLDGVGESACVSEFGVGAYVPWIERVYYHGAGPSVPDGHRHAGCLAPTRGGQVPYA